MWNILKGSPTSEHHWNHWARALTNIPHDCSSNEGDGWGVPFLMYKIEQMISPHGIHSVNFIQTS